MRTGREQTPGRDSRAGLAVGGRARRAAQLGLLVFACGLAAACGRSGGVPVPAADTRPQLPAFDAPEYVIGAGDTLSIQVYRLPDLSATVPVRPDGRISTPLVQNIVAAGRTPSELAREIERELRRFVREPTVTVLVTSFVGPPARQVRVVGEAAQPLAIPFREGMSVLDVMIQAGGLTRFAAGNRAEIVRRETPGGPAQVIPVRLADLLRDGDMSQDLPMRPGDTLVIPQSWF